MNLHPGTNVLRSTLKEIVLCNRPVLPTKLDDTTIVSVN